jgi:hypothetical protein
MICAQWAEHHSGFQFLHPLRRLFYLYHRLSMKIWMTYRRLTIVQMMTARVMKVSMDYFALALADAQLVVAVVAGYQSQAAILIRVPADQALAMLRLPPQPLPLQKSAMIMSEDAYNSLIALILPYRPFLEERQLAFQPIFAAVRCPTIQRKTVPQPSWQPPRPTTSRACADVFAAQFLPESLAMQSAFRICLADI